MSGIAPHPDLTACIVLVGAEQSPVLVVDNLVADPHALVAAASDAIYLKLGPLYPGVRAPAPEDYAEVLAATLNPLIEQAFGCAIEPELELCAFSLVTTPPEALSVAQRIPHFDGVEADRLAFVHYLCPPERGGTAIYRHRSTGFERIDASRLQNYRAALERDMQSFGEPAAEYLNGNTEIFEQIASFEAAFNRLILYPGSLLHSGNIGGLCPLVEDARSGRLTMNGFAQLTQPFQSDVGN
ncbi:MAG TPA: DUF6445 family protein [Sphingomicrobium sp.]